MSDTSFRIGEKTVGGTEPAYIIAELSGNHSGKIENALKLMQVAYESGADAIKIQVYRPDTITLNSYKDDFLLKEKLYEQT